MVLYRPQSNYMLVNGIVLIFLVEVFSFSLFFSSTFFFFSFGD